MDDLDGIKLGLVANQLISGQPVKVRASGYSMMPFIREGDTLVMNRAKMDHLKPGDIVAFIRNRLLFIHRIIEIGLMDEWVLTKGDHLAISDSLIKPEEVLGVVTFINQTSVAIRPVVHNLFNQLYHFCLVIRNKQNIRRNHRIVQLSMSSLRFRISLLILRLYRFFIFL